MCYRSKSDDPDIVEVGADGEAGGGMRLEHSPEGGAMSTLTSEGAGKGFCFAV